MFTAERLLLVEKQNLTGGRKVNELSIPYGAITRYSLESAGPLDLNAALKIWRTGRDVPIQKKINKKVDSYDRQRVLAQYDVSV